MTLLPQHLDDLRRSGLTDETIRACGFRSVFRFSELERWTHELADALSAAGPTFVLLDVAPVPNAPGPRSPGPAGERAGRFITALGGDPDP